MNGLVNAHTHVYGALAALGLPPPAAEPRNFIEILERVWWRLDRALDERSLRASARLYAAEALIHGTTTLVDHHESPGCIAGSLDVIADACQELGVRAVLCYGATERNGGRDEARAGLAECRRFARANARPLVRGMVGLHASFTVSDATLAEAAALCRELELPLHVHVAEDRADVEDARRRGYAGPLERLLAFDALPEGSVLAHGVHLNETQVLATEARGLWLVHNPRSNRANRVGWAAALSASRRVALGTDGFVSDMTAESEALEELAGGPVPERLERGRDLARERFARALPGAARPPGPELGPDSDTVEWLPEAKPETHLARRVTVGGRIVVDGGRLITGDLDEIRAHAREEAARLGERMLALA